MKKLILILVIITFIGFIVIIGKSRLDSGLSKKVFAELSELTKELEEEANLEIYFQDVEVNSFGMEVLIKNLELENGTDLFSVEELKLGTSYEELLNIIKVSILCTIIVRIILRILFTVLKFLLTFLEIFSAALKIIFLLRSIELI